MRPYTALVLLGTSYLCGKHKVECVVILSEMVVNQHSMCVSITEVTALKT